MKVIPKTGDAFKVKWKQILLGWKIGSGKLLNKRKKFREVSFFLPVPEGQIQIRSFDAEGGGNPETGRGGHERIVIENIWGSTEKKVVPETGNDEYSKWWKLSELK